jgi:acetyltransferase-like isoleucine patch superfamily enzyme
VNNSWFKKRFRISKGVLIIEENAKLRVNGNFSMYDGSTVYVAKNATLELGDGSFINTCSEIECHLYISIGNNCYISDHVNIQDSDIHAVIENEEKKVTTKPIIIGNNVWIGKKSMILKGVTIGTGSIIAAGSIVTRDVASNCMVAGNPARIIKRNIGWE